MVQLKVLSGKKAGTAWVARRFPVRIGRSAAADLQLEEDGVWDQHLQLDFDPAEGIVLSAQPNALATVNGQPVQQTVLRNGDAIEIGSLKTAVLAQRNPPGWACASAKGSPGPASPPFPSARLASSTGCSAEGASARVNAGSALRR